MTRKLSEQVRVLEQEWVAEHAAGARSGLVESQLIYSQVSSK